MTSRVNWMYKCTGCCTISTKMCDVSNLVYLCNLLTYVDKYFKVLHINEFNYFTQGLLQGCGGGAGTQVQDGVHTDDGVPAASLPPDLWGQTHPCSLQGLGFRPTPLRAHQQEALPPGPRQSPV